MSNDPECPQVHPDLGGGFKLRGLVGRVLFSDGGRIELELINQTKFEEPIRINCDRGDEKEGVTFDGKRVKNTDLLAALFTAFEEGKEVEFFSCETGYNYGVTFVATFTTKPRN